MFIALAAAPLAGQMTVGLRGGIGNATLSRDMPRVEQGEGRGSRFGVVSGIDVGIPLGGAVDLRAGIGLAQKGGGADPPPSVTAGRAFVDATTELDYLQLSALLRASADAEGGFLNVGVLAGPYMAVNLSCSIALTTLFSPPGSGEYRSFGGQPPWGTETSCDGDARANFRTADFGLAFGAGAEVKLGDSIALAFDVIYAIGLTGIDDDGTRNRHLALQSGLVFATG
ncbi:outer membrane beta-barrel protein [Candidatus Palauibacter sp.]|uniref:outer membrane beta-barrel protein n=1 Tax=Candidatus Palauibacter sp. TaxID=3101350 RepID=UPI003B5BAEF7